MDTSRRPLSPLRQDSADHESAALRHIVDRLKPTLDLVLEHAASAYGAVGAFMILLGSEDGFDKLSYSPTPSINRLAVDGSSTTSSGALSDLIAEAIEKKGLAGGVLEVDSDDRYVLVAPSTERKQVVALVGYIFDAKPSMRTAKQLAAYANRAWQYVNLQYQALHELEQAKQCQIMFSQMPIASMEVDITGLMRELESLGLLGKTPESISPEGMERVQHAINTMRTIRVNSEMASLFGAGSQDAFLERFPAAIIDLNEPFSVAAMSALLNGKKSVEGRYPTRTFDGRELMLYIKLVFNVRTHLPSTCFAYITDLTEQLRDEMRLKLSLEIDKALLGTATMARLSKTVLVGLSDLVPYSLATIRIKDDHSSQLNLVALDGLDYLTQLVSKTIADPGVKDLSKASIILVDAGSPEAEDPSVRHYFEAGIKTILVAALTVRKENIGFIFLAQKEPNAFGSEHIEALQGIADDLAVGLYTLKLQANAKKKNQELEKRVKVRTSQLEAANKELESFFYSISHELRSPLRAIEGYTAIVQEEVDAVLMPEARANLQSIRESTYRMSKLIEDLIKLARYTRSNLSKARVNLSAIISNAGEALKYASPDRVASFKVQPDVVAFGDPQFIKSLLDELVSNAWIFSSQKDKTEIELGAYREGGETIYYLKDNGCGFDMNHADQLFYPFHRLHRHDEYPGAGIGLATAERIVRRHGGRIWADSAVGEGSTFYFTLGE